MYAFFPDPALLFFAEAANRIVDAPGYDVHGQVSTSSICPHMKLALGIEIDKYI